MKKKKIRKPSKFGIANEVFSFGFSVNKEDLVVEFDGGPQDPGEVWFEAKHARWLAKQLIKAAEYLEQEDAKL